MAQFGGKGGAGVYQAIINLMPPHDTYIEPFLGSGAVMKWKAPAYTNIGMDLDDQAIQNPPFPMTKSPIRPAYGFFCKDSIPWLSKYIPTHETVIYCDPPYLHSTRSGHDRYQFEMTTEDHERLLDALTFLGEMSKCYILLSGYSSKLYNDTLIKNYKWKSINFQAMTRGGVRTETVWMNFDPGTMHYHTYAGVDFGDRQRIRRKAARWAKNYRKLPPGERQSIMAAMLSTDIV